MGAGSSPVKNVRLSDHPLFMKKLPATKNCRWQFFPLKLMNHWTPIMFYVLLKPHKFNIQLVFSSSLCKSTSSNLQYLQITELMAELVIKVILNLGLSLPEAVNCWCMLFAFGWTNSFLTEDFQSICHIILSFLI